MFGLESAAVEWLGVGAVLVILGALIKFQEWTFLVAGYDDSSSVPEEVVADLAGNALLPIGIGALALGAIVQFGNMPSYLPYVFVAGVLVVAGWLLYQLRTYTPASAT